MEVLIAVVLLVVGGIGLVIQHGEKRAKERERKQQLESLAQKYAGSPVQADILAGQIRVGMTVEQLIDAWGPPVAVDTRMLKTKVVYTYKYAQSGARSFRQRVRVENGIVVGWTNT